MAVENMIPEIPGVAVIMFMNWVAINLGLPRKFAPLLAWLMGVFIGYFTYESGHVVEVLYYGTFLAASAVGFHSGGKNTAQQFKDVMDKNKKQ